MLEIKDLNDNQRAAAEWGEGSMLVLAGPGSGKTLVLTLRVARLIRESPRSRFKVLGLTFTTKAADEMRDRVSRLLGPEAYRARLTTFHSFAAEVLRQHGSHFGLRPDFTIITQDADRLGILSDAIAEAGGNGHPPGASERRILAVIDRLLHEGYDGSRHSLPLQATRYDWIRPVYKSYMRLMIQSNCLDFGSLLVYCLRLFLERERIARHYRTVYPFVCVDEYQDTNRAQDRLLRTLCPEPNANLFVAADDDQTLCQRNGASPERIRRLRNDYGMKVVQLPESYRCPSKIIDLANSLIQRSRERVADKKPLAAAVMPPNSGAVRVMRFTDHEREMAWVADDLKTRSVDPNQCVVLARSAKLLRSASDALTAVGLRPHLVVRKSEFESPLVRFVHSALRLANAPSNGDYLVVLCRAFCDLTDNWVQPGDAETASGLRGDSLLRGFADVASATSSEDVEPLLCSLRNRLLERLDHRGFVNSVFDWDSRRSATLSEGEKHEDTIQEKAVWRKLEHSIRRQLGGDSTLHQFLQELDMRQKTSPPGRSDIQCLTIHLAKGKEFHHVYLVGLAEDQLPSYYANRNGVRMEEERRSCFVAITRARSSLTLTHASSYFGWPKQPSRFLAEMGWGGIAVRSPIERGKD